jgi:TPR repeat protein
MGQEVPAHSPIPELFIAALHGKADKYKEGVVASVDIWKYLHSTLIERKDVDLTPQEGPLPDQAFHEGAFLFRVRKEQPTELSPILSNYEDKAEKGDVTAELNAADMLSQNNNVRAVNLYKRAADAKDPYAQYELGVRYRDGFFGTVNYKKAAELFTIAVDAGVPAAQASLAQLYATGRGVRWDNREAVRLFGLAADQGYAYAQRRLADYYDYGEGGLKTDKAKAVELYKLAADQGDARAQAHIGYPYLNGRGGLNADKFRAATYFRLSANQGDSMGESNLGYFYEHGWGGLNGDLQKALALYHAAALQGDAFAIEQERRLSASLYYSQSPVYGSLEFLR